VLQQNHQAHSIFRLPTAEDPLLGNIIVEVSCITAKKKEYADNFFIVKASSSSSAEAPHQEGIQTESIWDN
jgi:hypothetical protein